MRAVSGDFRRHEWLIIISIVSDIAIITFLSSYNNNDNNNNNNNNIIIIIIIMILSPFHLSLYSATGKSKGTLGYNSKGGQHLEERGQAN